MENSDKKSSSMMMMAVSLVVVLVIGGLVGYLIGHHKKSSSMSSTMSMTATGTTPSALALNNSLVTLGIEHMTLTDQAIDAALDGSPDASATAAALYANGNDIGAAVGSVYGSSAQSTFDSVWKLHLDQFVNYAVAEKKGDTAGAQTALNTINSQYTIPLAQYLAKANPNLPEATLQTALTDHVNMTAQVIMDHVKGNYTAEATDLGKANTMMTSLFSTLSSAIAKQFPAKFAN